MAEPIKDMNFESEAGNPINALVLIFDLSGFSKFFSQPDVHLYVPKYLNKIFNCMSIIINGGNAYWDANTSKYYSAFPEPIHQKFLGDGALYIWNLNNFKSKDIIFLANRLWILKNGFKVVKNSCSDDVPVIDIPDRIRFGVSAGSVYKLTYNGSEETEYIGYPINLASRLQSYCRDLGFIASARIKLPQKTLSEYGYIKVVAKNIKGFPKEIVIVDDSEYQELDNDLRDQLFDKIQ